jgi:release factor glutamine methyltransferase
MPSISELKMLFRNRLKEIYPVSEIDSQFSIIIQEVTGFTRIEHIQKSEELVGETNLARMEDILNQLVNHKPIQYIIGKTEFYGLPFVVNENVLIPRQETELLVDILVKRLSGATIQNLLDIGTGSGCIGISLKKNLPSVDVYALDISEKALETAKQNALMNDVQINFIEGNILDTSLGLNPQFETIVSNPPYVRNSEIVLMHKNVLGYEPHSALFVPDNDPLLFYKAIAVFCETHLKKSGLLALEINEALGEQTKQMLEKYQFAAVEILKDLTNKDRFILARKV